MKRESATQMGVISRTECNLKLSENAVEIPYARNKITCEALSSLRTVFMDFHASGSKRHGGSRPSLGGVSDKHILASLLREGYPNFSAMTDAVYKIG